MKQVFRGMLPLRGAGIVVSLLAAGCVTSSDLAKLDQSMAQKLDAHAKAQRAEMGSLREQVKTLRTEAESLRAQVGALQLNTRAALETLKEQEVINEQALRDLSTIMVSTKKEVEGYAAKLVNISARSTISLHSSRRLEQRSGPSPRPCGETTNWKRED